MSKKPILDLESLHALARKASYNARFKEQFTYEAKRFLKAIADALGEGKIHYNPGGIAVAGDASLRCPKKELYINISDSSVGPLMYRWELDGKAKGFNDMGVNLWLHRGTTEDVIEIIKDFDYHQNLERSRRNLPFVDHSSVSA
jgi:hypothetical protein